MKHEFDFRRKHLVILVSAACMTMASTAAMAVADCTTPVTGSQSGTCAVGNNVDFVVKQGASVSTSDNTPAISVASGVTASSIVNNGSVSGGLGDAILVNGIVNGGIYNGFDVIGANSATITAAVDGIHVSGGSASNVESVGTITAGNGVSTSNGAVVGNGIAVDGGASVSYVSNSGTITASGSGLLVSGATSNSVTNSGMLQSQTVSYTSEYNGQTYVDYGPQGGGILVSNNSQINGSVSNTGVINTAGGSGITIDASNVNGNVSNSNSITANGNGISVQDGSRVYGLSNSGTINANTGINLSNSTDTGSLTNSGTLSGFEGIQVSGSTVTGAVTNTHSISTSDVAIGVTNGSTVNSVTNNPLATINTNGTGILVDQSTVRTNVTNQGTLTTTYGSGIQLSNSAGAASVTNSGTITTTDGDGVQLGNSSHVTGNLTNTGSISVGEDANGINVENNARVGGNIVNTSSITINTLSIDGGEGTQAGINVQSASSVVGSISNTASGSINASGGDGVLVSNSTVGTGISNAGQITADNGIVLTSLDGGEGAATKILAGGITNSGSISAAVDGIDVNSGSTVLGGITNTAAGTIFAAQQAGDTSAGISVRNGSTVSGGVTNAGLINATIDGGEGSSAGIAVTALSTVNGGISNTGTINATNENGYGAAIVVAESTVNGGITNGATGQLNGSFGGIYVVDSAVNGDIANQGAISGGINIGQNSTVTGNVANSGTVTNTNGANIAINNSTVTGAVSNTSRITNTSGYDAIQIGSSNIGSITNGAGATISGATALDIAQSTTGQGGIVNAGTLTGSNGAGVHLNDTTVAGNISNAATGTITGTTYGVELENASSVTGKIINNGTMSGTLAGLSITDSATGGVNNAGHLTGGANGLALSFANISGDVVNSGNLKGTTGDALSSVGTNVTGTIANSGQIVSTNARGIAIDGGEGSTIGAIANQAGGSIQGATQGVSLSDVTLSRGFSNAGTISGTSGNGVLLENSTIAAGGIVNASTGTISGAQAAVLVSVGSSITGDINNAGHANGGYAGLEIERATTVHGNVVNSGVIGGAQGVALYDASVTGNLTNSGTIAATAGNAILVSGATVAGQIANSGTITATNGSGILLDGGEGLAHVGSISNTAGGKIIATGGAAIRATDATVAGGITNAGTLSGTYGIFLTNSTTGSLTNQAGGTITGANGLGIATTGLHVNGDVTNAGTVSGSMFGLGMAGSTVTGSITNSGAMSGPGVGVYLVAGTNVAGNVSNSGTITTGAQGNGIDLFGSNVAGSIVNTGRIAGGTGIALTNASTVGGNIVNSGSMSDVSADASTVTGSLQNSGKMNGSVALTNGSKLGGDIVNSGSMSGVSADASTVTGSLQNSGKIDGSVALTNGAKLGGIVNSGTIAGGISVANSTLSGNIDNSGTIGGATAVNLSGAKTPVTINNTGSLAGAVQLGAGTLNLNGNASQVTGAVNGTSASTVNFNGNFTTANTFTADAINIASGATLVDQHDLTAAGGVTNAGTLAVNSATPVTVHGDYTQAAGGTYSMQASSPTNYSRLTVTGNANLAPNTNIFVNVAGSSTLVPRGVLSGVIQAGRLNASTFNVTDNSVLFDFKGVVNGNNVDLNVINAQTVLQQTNLNRNFAGSGAARTFDYLIANGTNSAMSQVIAALGGMTTSQQVSNAVRQTLPVLTGASAAGVTATMNDVSRVVQARQEESRGLSAGDGYAHDGHMWVKPFGSWAHQDDDNGAAGFTSTTAGLVVGGDAAVSARDRVGGAFAYAHINQDGTDSVAPQSARTDSYQAIVYGSHSLDPRTEVSWQADLGYNNTDGSRTITFTGGNTTAASSYGGWNVHVGAGIGHVFDLSSAVNLTPSLRIDYTTVKNNGYTESGAGALNLNVDGQRAQELVIGADAKVLYAVSEKFSLTANAGLGYDALAKNAVVVSSFTGGGPAFATQGVSPSHMLARGGAGVTYHGMKGWEIVGRYDVETRSKFTNQTVSLKVRKAF